jgi:hypothetical protein
MILDKRYSQIVHLSDDVELVAALQKVKVLLRDYLASF